MTLRTWLVIATSLALELSPTPAHAYSTPPATLPTTAPAAAIQWLTRLEDAYAAAQVRGQPLLVIVWANSCPWCKKLDEELAKPAAQQKLSDWVCLRIEVSKVPQASGLWKTGVTPALRILTPIGQLIAARDGYVSEQQLLAWLEGNRAAAVAGIGEELLGEGEPDLVAMNKLVGLLGSADPIRREAAIRRLMPHADRAAPLVARAFADGKLASRLASLELLTAWVRRSMRWIHGSPPRSRPAASSPSNPGADAAPAGNDAHGRHARPARRHPPRHRPAARVGNCVRSHLHPRAPRATRPRRSARSSRAVEGSRRRPGAVATNGTALPARRLRCPGAGVAGRPRPARLAR